MSRYLQYGTVVICFLAVMVILLLERRKQGWTSWPIADRYLIPLGLGLTVVADTFLVLLVRYELAGVAFFCMVQTVYALYLEARKRRSNIVWAVRFSVVLLIWIGLAIADALDILSLAGGYSMGMLIMNVILAWRRAPSRRAGHIFALGLTLFLLCDLCVGLFNASAYLAAFPAAVGPIASRLIWWFYLPSQILIALSYERSLHEKGKSYT